MMDADLPDLSDYRNRNKQKDRMKKTWASKGRNTATNDVKQGLNYKEND